MAKRKSKSNAKKTKKAAAAKTRSADSYAAHRERARARSQRQTRSARDIAPLPEVARPRRKALARKSLLRFCRSYMPHTFSLPFSQDHLLVIERIQEAALHGGLFALAMPRGSGKTSLCLAGALWAWLYGHRRFVVLVGASDQRAEELIRAVKEELYSNDLLAEDFPEVCAAVRELEGKSNRCPGQYYQGRLTRIEWGKRRIVAPWIPEAAPAGSVVVCTGIEASIRGLRHVRPDGVVLRPDFAMIDDPQTDESARSPSQTAMRERLVNEAVLGLAGPTRRMAAVCPCTIIARGDLADRLTDPQQNPEWRGVRTRLLKKFPENMDLWAKYDELRVQSLQEYGDIRLATRFYRRHRREMDRGAEVSWPARKDQDELSAVQHAMNLYFRSPAAFAANYQNQPEEPQAGRSQGVTPEQVLAHTGPLPRGTVPVEAQWLTAGVDIQQNVLFYLVAAWTERFRGAVVDYGAWPPQRQAYFRASEARPGLAARYGGTVESSIYQGLLDLLAHLFGSRWNREDDQPQALELVLVDANWSISTDGVYRAAQRAEWAGRVVPCHGRYIGASSRPLSQRKAQPGDRLGPGWLLRRSRQKGVRHLVLDVNRYKSLVAERLAAAPGGETIRLFRARRGTHRLLADHLASEYAVRTESQGRVVDEWHLRPGWSENHWWDCLVMAAAAASVLGARTPTMEEPRKPKRVSFRQWQQQKKKARGG